MKTHSLFTSTCFSVTKRKHLILSINVFVQSVEYVIYSNDHEATQVCEREYRMAQVVLRIRVY